MTKQEQAIIEDIKRQATLLESMVKVLPLIRKQIDRVWFENAKANNDRTHY